jgi:molybdopterin/thiamine biosynthesis adenylyltransferase
MINEHLTRQLDLIPLEILDEKITIIGAGAIGGWVTLSLAKMGFDDITVYDFDKVDTVNMNSQFFRFKDIGESKVVALQKLVEDFTGVKIKTVEARYEKGMFPGVVISAVDSMEVRRLIWANHANKSPFTKAVIDPRMGAESALLYVMNPMDPKDQKSYEKSLYSDSDAVQEACTSKSTVYCANLLSGLVVKSVKDLLTTTKYLRSAQWDVKNNELLCFNKL